MRHGWFALPDTSDVVVRVIRVGGRLTGLAALRNLGLYLPAPSIIDIAVPRGAANLRQPEIVVLGSTWRGRAHQLGRCAPSRTGAVELARNGGRSAPDCVATRDSRSRDCVLRRLTEQPHTDQSRFDAVYAKAPSRVQTWRPRVDGRAEAWGETVLRLRLTDAGVPFEPQVTIAGRRYDGKSLSGLVCRDRRDAALKRLGRREPELFRERSRPGHPDHYCRSSNDSRDVPAARIVVGAVSGGDPSSLGGGRRPQAIAPSVLWRSWCLRSKLRRDVEIRPNLDCFRRNASNLLSFEKPTRKLSAVAVGGQGCAAAASTAACRALPLTP